MCNCFRLSCWSCWLFRCVSTSPWAILPSPDSPTFRFVLTEIIRMAGRIKSTFFPLLCGSLLLSDLAVSSFAFLFWQVDTTNFYNQFPSLDRIILVSDETGFAWCSEMPFSLHRLWDPLLGFSSAAGFLSSAQNPPRVQFCSHKGHVNKTHLSQDPIKCSSDTGDGASKLFELLYQAPI